MGQIAKRIDSFNTQPPEGGWTCRTVMFTDSLSFNTQPPEGGWKGISRPYSPTTKFQHTAARRRLVLLFLAFVLLLAVSTHSRPKAAGTTSETFLLDIMFQHTAARRRLAPM